MRSPPPRGEGSGSAGGAVRAGGGELMFGLVGVFGAGGDGTGVTRPFCVAAVQGAVACRSFRRARTDRTGAEIETSGGRNTTTTVRTEPIVAVSDYNKYNGKTSGICRAYAAADRRENFAFSKKRRRDRQYKTYPEKIKHLIVTVIVRFICTFV